MGDALQRLSKQSLAMKVSWKVAKLNKKYKQKIKEGQEFYKEVLKSVAQLDDKGEFVPREMPATTTPDGKELPGKKIPGSYIVLPEKEDELQQKTKEFMELEVDFGEVDKIRLDEIQHLNLMPSDLEALEPFLLETELRVVPGAKK